MTPTEYQKRVECIQSDIAMSANWHRKGMVDRATNLLVCAVADCMRLRDDLLNVRHFANAYDGEPRALTAKCQVCGKVWNASDMVCPECIR